jgi:hypothetical protein
MNKFDPVIEFGPKRLVDLTRGVGYEPSIDCVVVGADVVVPKLKPPVVEEAVVRVLSLFGPADPKINPVDPLLLVELKTAAVGFVCPTILTYKQSGDHFSCSFQGSL